MEIYFKDFNKQLSIKARDTRTPLIGVFELTGRCNLACKMCYVRKSPSDPVARRGELSAARWKQIADQAVEAGLFYLLLSGGEVFLRPDFLDIYDHLRSLGLSIAINTNASLVTPKIASRLGDFPPDQVSVTLYGASAETYEKVSGSGAGFERTIRGLDLLREYNLNIQVRTTIIQQNYQDLEKIFNIAKGYGSNLRVSDYVFTTRDDIGTDPYSVRLSPQEMAKVLRKYYALLGLDVSDEPKPVSEVPNASEQIEHAALNYIDPTYAFPCGVAQNSFVISSNGKMLGCLLLNEPAIPTTDNFINDWNALYEVCKTVPICEECNSCELKRACRACSAKLKGETGSFERKAPYVCELTEQFVKKG